MANKNNAPYSTSSGGESVGASGNGSASTSAVIMRHGPQVRSVKMQIATSIPRIELHSTHFCCFVRVPPRKQMPIVKTVIYVIWHAKFFGRNAASAARTITMHAPMPIISSNFLTSCPKLLIVLNTIITQKTPVCHHCIDNKPVF